MRGEMLKEGPSLCVRLKVSPWRLNCFSKEYIQYSNISEPWVETQIMNPLRTWLRFVLGSSTVCGETRQKWLQQYVTSQGIYAKNGIKAFLIKEQLIHSYTYLALFVIYIDPVRGTVSCMKRITGSFKPRYALTKGVKSSSLHPIAVWVHLTSIEVSGPPRIHHPPQTHHQTHCAGQLNKSC